MEKKILTQEQIDWLRERLPDEAVSQHPTKTYLSSIKAIYVVERLNKVFGIGGWSYKVETVDNKTDMIVVKVIFTVEDYGIYFECFGGNDNGGENSKNFDLGDAYKGATTDAITKISSYLEIGMDVFKGLHKGKSSAPYKKYQETPKNEPQSPKDNDSEEYKIFRKEQTFIAYKKLGLDEQNRVQQAIIEHQKLPDPFLTDEQIKPFLK